jgi:hypothetical protein
VYRGTGRFHRPSGLIASGTGPRAGPPAYHGLIMRQGVETVKTDVHVRRFAERAVGRALNDQDVVEVVTRAASFSVSGLDWAIW